MNRSAIDRSSWSLRGDPADLLFLKEVFRCRLNRVQFERCVGRPRRPSARSRVMSSTPVATTQTMGVGSTLPALQNDFKTVRGTKTAIAATRPRGVLGNDSDPDGDTLTVTGISAAGAGDIGMPLAGQYGTLTLAPDGTYSYTADHAAALAEGLTGHDLFTYTAADQDGNASSATLDLAVVGHAGGVMDADTFTAVESTTGDTISGVLYDNT